MVKSIGRRYLTRSAVITTMLLGGMCTSVGKGNFAATSARRHAHADPDLRRLALRQPLL